MSTDTHELRRRESRRQLALKRARMPIIDGARIPLQVMRERSPEKANRQFVWFQILRPVLLVVFWLLAVRYAWAHLVGAPDDLPIAHQILLYGVAVLLIVLAMLGLAPLRRREVQHEPSGETGPASLAAVSEFANLPEDQLEELQHAQRVVVHHDATGQFERAEDTDKLLGLNGRPLN